MRVRVIQLRILGVALAALWLAAFGLVLVGYRPGGPADLVVGIAAVGPALIAIAAVRWPPAARGDRAFAGIAWLALASILLLVPSLAGLVGQLTVRGPQTLLPSLEAAYPWLLALVATGLFTGLGLARRRLGESALRRRRMVSGALIAVVLVVAAGTAFSAAAIANELALADRPANASRFGPTDPAIEPPPCTDPVGVGETAHLQLRMDGSIDGTYTGQVALDGSARRRRRPLGGVRGDPLRARPAGLRPARGAGVDALGRPAAGPRWSRDWDWAGTRTARSSPSPSPRRTRTPRRTAACRSSTAPGPATAGSRSTARWSGGSCPRSRCWSAARTSRAGAATWTTGCSPTASWARSTGR